MVNYPNMKKSGLADQTVDSLKQDTSRRGYSLENAINASNQYYLAHQIANIHKKPTPIQIVSVSYPKRSAARITEAYFKVPSTTDYNGIYKGKYIDFEAKECQKTSFPFSNIHPHQIAHLESILYHGGIAFVILAFTRLHEVYLIEAPFVIDQYKNGQRKSLTYTAVQRHGHLIPQGYMPELDYLKVVDQLYFKGESEW